MRTRSLAAKAALLAAGLLAGTWWHASGADTRDEEVRALRALAADIDRRLRALDDPTSIASDEGKFQLRLRGNIQADGRFFVGDDIADNDTFLLRRVRPSFEGTVAEKFSFRVMPDFAGSATTLLDAYASYRHSAALNVLVGKTKVPFDLERLVSQTDLLFLERAFPTSLAPNRDIGVQVFGDLFDGRLNYQLAWLNGARDNDSTTVDAGDGKDVALRLFAHPFRPDADSIWNGLGVGLAVSRGEKESGAPNNYRTNAQQTFFSWRPNVASSGVHSRIEPQFYFYSGPFGVIGSWIASTQELAIGETRARLRHTGWFLAAHYALTGEDASYRGVTPKRSFSWTERTWGAVELAARVGQLDIDDSAFPLCADPATSATRVTGCTTGVNWYLNPNVKLSLNLEHSSFSGGRGPGATVTADDENAILVRTQLRF